MPSTPGVFPPDDHLERFTDGVLVGGALSGDIRIHAADARQIGATMVGHPLERALRATCPEWPDART